MRVILVVSLVALLAPATAVAQTAPAPATPSIPPTTAPASPGTASTRGGDITRDEYIQRAVERARRAAEKRFDRMDTDHDGVLTSDERRAARTQRRAATSQQ
jgi:hypothetical protein